jgi:type VI protein secretion system component Hcp
LLVARGAADFSGVHIVMGWNNLVLKATLEKSGALLGECALQGYENQVEIDSLTFSFGTPGSTPEEHFKTVAESATEESTKLETEEQEFAMEQFFRRKDPKKEPQLAKDLLGRRVEVARPPGSATKPPFQNLKVTKRFDRASTVLLTALRKQEMIPQAVFVALRRGTLGVNSKPLPWVTLTLKNAQVASVDLQTTPGDKSAVIGETVTFDYDEVEIQYRPVRIAGSFNFSADRRAPKGSGR